MQTNSETSSCSYKHIFTLLGSVVKLHSESLSHVLDSKVYMEHINKKDMPNLIIDDFGTNLNLALSLFHEIDGNWAIEVSVKWDTFSCYPLAYIRSKHPFQRKTYSFKDELADIRATLSSITESQLRAVLSQTYVNILTKKENRAAIDIKGSPDK